MVNPWLALTSGADPEERSRTVRRAHEDFVALGHMGPQVRPVVAESWRRSAGALDLATGFAAPIDLAGDALEDYRAQHPLAQVMPLFRELLGSIAHDGIHLMAVCDERGRMLWVEGHPGVRSRAERMNFCPGARWDEGHAGTNAPGTALTTGHAVQIFATEHYNPLVQPWSCAAAPVHDPRTGRLLGAVDITGGDHVASPHSLALVQATARAAEAQLLALAPSAAAGGPRLSLTALGRDEAVWFGEGRRLRLSRRHSEILVLLACHPEGLTGDRLALLLYGDRPVNPVTLRAELSRLRRLLGPVLASRPYRLCSPLTADVTTVTEELSAGDLHAALRTYRGPLLPLSDAPGIGRLRRLVEGRLRRAVLAARDEELLRLWAESGWGEDDLEVRDALRTLTDGPAARPAATAATSAQPRRT